MISTPTPELFADEIFGFHCQQAAEKALKAWITYAGAVYPKTHDLRSLLTIIASTGEDVAEWEPLVELNAFAVLFRYEALDNEETDDPLDRALLLDGIERLITDVRRRLSTTNTVSDESE